MFDKIRIKMKTAKVFINNEDNINCLFNLKSSTI